MDPRQLTRLPFRRHIPRVCLAVMLIAVASSCTSNDAATSSDGTESDPIAATSPSVEAPSVEQKRPLPTPVVARVLPTSTSVPTPVPTPTPDPRLADAVEVALTYYWAHIEALDDPLNVNILDNVALEHVDGSARGVAMQSVVVAADRNVYLKSDGAQLEVLGEPRFTSYDEADGFELDKIIAVDLCAQTTYEWRDIDTDNVIFTSAEHPFTVTVWIELVDGLVWGLNETTNEPCEFST